MSEKEKGSSSLDIFDHLGSEAPKQESVSSAAVPPPPPISTALVPDSDPVAVAVPPPPPSLLAASVSRAADFAALTPASPSVAPTLPTSTPPVSERAARPSFVSVAVPVSAEIPSSKTPASAIDTLVAHLSDPRLDFKADPKKTILGLPASGPPPSGSVPRLPAPPPSVRPGGPAIPPAGAAGSVRPSQSGMAAVPPPPPSVRPPLPSVRAMAAVKLSTATLLGTPSSNPASTQSQPVPPPAPSTSRAVDLDPQVDMEWDDEEATHVFDNKQHRGPLSSPPPVTKSSPPALPASAQSVPPLSSATPSARPARIPSTPPSVKSSALPSAAPIAAVAAVTASPTSIKVIPTAPATERNLEAPATYPPRSETVPPARHVEEQGNNATRGLILGLIAAIVAGGALMYSLTPKRGTLRIEVASADGRNLDRIDGMVDGKHQCDTAPCLVKDLDLGEHVIKVFANGYDKPEEQSITTTSGETRVSIVLRSPVRKASVHLGEAPAGAKVVLLGGDERREVSTFPSEVKELDPKIAWTVVGTLPGAPELRMPLSLSAGETREVLLPFAAAIAEVAPAPRAFQAPQPAAAPRAAFTPTARPAVGPSAPPAAPPPPASAPAPAAAPAPTTPTVAAADATGPATVNLNSIPASNVVLDGTPLGLTPKLGLSVTSGKHTVLFINSELELRKKLDFVIKPGETKTVATKLTP